MNLDILQQFPNQEIDNDQTECAALTIADIAGNYDGRLYDPDFVYAMTLYLMNQAPNTGGLNLYAAMQAAVAYGLLPMSLATFTAKVMGELYVANWQNYPKDQQNAALRYARKGVVSLPTWYSLLDHMNRLRAAPAIRLRWYENFDDVGPNGIFPSPTGDHEDHTVPAYDHVVNGDTEYLLIKPLRGQNIGAGGYALLSREIYETIKIEAYGFDPYANRIISLMRITISRLQYLLNFLRS